MDNQLKELLQNASNIKERFVVLFLAIDDGYPVADAQVILSNIYVDDFSTEQRWIIRKFNEHQWNPREILNVKAVVFYAWVEPEYEDGGMVFDGHYEIYRIDTLSVESIIMSEIEADNSGVPF